MTVTKSKNLIANRNTGGNKKQGLVSSIGKSNSVRQSQLVRASSNDKTVYCINQVGGIGRFRNQLSSADSTNCLPKLYTINSALQDSIKFLDKYYNNYLFSYILIHNIKFNDTHVFINNSSTSSHIFNSANFIITDKYSQDLDVSFNNISLTPNNTFFLNKFSNNNFNFNNFDGYLNIIYRSSENYNDISINDVSLNNNGFLYNKIEPWRDDLEPYSLNTSHNILDNYGFYLNYYPFLYGSLHEYRYNYKLTNKLENNFYVTFFIHLKQN